MASKTGAIWAIDLGNNSLKALQLSVASGVVEVIGFDTIQHSKILTSNELQEGEKDELIALSLRQLVSRNDMETDEIIISVPSQNSFARFVNLPPVEKKKIPEIVSFEATQQIPFDINNVQWDWQMMGETESGENRVGIFAIKNDEINSLLEYFNGEGIQVNYVQMAPMALYNYVSYDCIDILEKSNNNGIIIIDIGAENTDLVVCTNSTVWQRSIPMGGNAFTKAIAEAFKLHFEKAEKLKRTAPMSKYARQIYQAMKPVFTDLASEVQRSLNFYSRSYPDTKFCKVMAFGGGTKMRGLLKYLQQTLQVTVEKPDAFKRLALSPDISAAKFHENVNDFSIVYGLALQGLGLAEIESNLLPSTISRSIAWAKKTKYFVAAAFLILLVSLMSFGRTLYDKMSYNSQENVRSNIKNIIAEARDSGSKLTREKNKSSESATQIENAKAPFRHRDIIPLVTEAILSQLPNPTNNPQQKELYNAFDEGNIRAVKAIPREEREQLFVTSLDIQYADDIAFASFEGAEFQTGGQRRGPSRKQKKPTLTDLLQKKFGGKAKFGLQTTKKGGGGGEKIEGETIKPGFVITLAGYTPYKNPIKLIDPVGVDNPEEWGFITRLMNLEEKYPFQLYKRDNKNHFQYKIEPVDIAKEMPAGIGETKSREIISRDGSKYQENVIMDPMTEEIISAVSAVDEDGREKLNAMGNPITEENDYWFTINLKFVWQNDSKPSAQEKSDSEAM